MRNCRVRGPESQNENRATNTRSVRNRLISSRESRSKGGSRRRSETIARQFVPSQSDSDVLSPGELGTILQAASFPSSDRFYCLTSAEKPSGDRTGSRDARTEYPLCRCRGASHRFLQIEIGDTKEPAVCRKRVTKTPIRLHSNRL